MKKPYSFDQVDQVVSCHDCGRKLKLNLLFKKPDAQYCYKCFQSRKAYTDLQTFDMSKYLPDTYQSLVRKVADSGN